MTRYFVDQNHPWLRNLHFRDLAGAELLARLPSESAREGRPKAVILDLDSTLFCVGPRTRAVFEDFLRSHPQPPAHWSRLPSILTPDRQRYDIELTFSELLNDPVEGARLWAEFRPFWEKGFFSSPALRFDEPYPGAVAFCETLRARGFELVYLTGRDRPRTGAGTWDALRAARFPLDEGSHIFMKNDPKESDLDYKERAASVLRSRFDVRAFLDNEPENLVMAAAAFPGADIVLKHTVMSPRVPTSDIRSALGERPLFRLTDYT